MAEPTGPQLRRGTAADDEALWDLFRTAFAAPEGRREAWVASMDPDRVLIAEGPRGEVAAASHVRSFGQWFGGARVRVGGFSPVAVQPEARGRGLGTAVTAGQLPDLRDRGEVVAGLFPASLALYRRSGFELAGSYLRRRFPARDLAAIAPSRHVDVRRGSALDIDAVHRCYAASAPARHGALERDEWWWSHRLPRDLGRTLLYVVDDPDRTGEVLGYAVFGSGPGRPPYDYSIHVGEVLADDADVLRALWRVVASSGSQAPDVHVIGPAEDDLLLLAPHAAPDVVETEIRWMVRLVDVAGAMAARGWPAGTSGRIDLLVADPVAPWNEGRWRLEVEGGRATAVPGGDGDVRCTIGGLSAWWAGYASPRRLARTGSLHGPVDALDAMGRLLPAEPPVLVDFY
ncbi:MAG: GNAT family N-acetyltransferase [Acidimicrobiales bacterium]